MRLLGGPRHTRLYCFLFQYSQTFLTGQGKGAAAIQLSLVSAWTANSLWRTSPDRVQMAKAVCFLSACQCGIHLNTQYVRGGGGCYWIFIFPEGAGLYLGLYIAEKVVYSHLFSKRLVSLTTVYSLKISVVHLYRPAGMLRCRRWDLKGFRHLHSPPTHTHTHQ